ncbi:MAG: transposase [Verrucomicrobiota bacterium]
MPLPFQPFDKTKALRIYFTNMPHWRQDGCTYFVTYRLDDSIPLRNLEFWEDEKEHWMASEGVDLSENETWKDGFSKLDEHRQRTFLKAFNSQLNEYLDEGRGSCVLRDPRCAEIVLSGWQYFDSKHYDLHDIVVMPNHVHLMLTPYPTHELEKILQSRKGQSSREINRMMGRQGRLWQKHSYDHIVRNGNEAITFSEYIANNPKWAKLRKGEFQHRSFDWQSKFAEEFGE